MPCVQRKAIELGPMTHFGSVNHVARQVASNHRPHTRPVFLIGKTDLRQLRSVVVTWDATSCRHGTDIEMLYGFPSSPPAVRQCLLITIVIFKS